MASKAKAAAIAMIALIILSVASYMVYENFFVAKSPGEGTGGGTSGTPVGNGVGTIWQSLYITNNDGTTYWANAPAPFSLASITGAPVGSSNFDTVVSMQNNIYMNVNITDVTAWTFSCQETIYLTTTSGTVIGYLSQSGSTASLSTTASSFTVNAEGSSLLANANQWVTGATSTAASIQSFLGQPSGTYYLCIALANISIQITNPSGTQTLTGSTPTSQNVLQWEIKIA